MKQKSHRTTTFILVGLVLFMGGLAYASVPLYRIFCQKTGYGGTPQIAVAMADRVSERKIRVFFNADTNPTLPWSFRPLQRAIDVKAGEAGLAFYHVKNKSTMPLSGMATYNVVPDKAGKYFHKVLCFCFNEQKLAAGQDMELPVHFYIHPDIDKDPLLNDVESITLSYTFFPFDKNNIPVDPHQLNMKVEAIPHD